MKAISIIVVILGVLVLLAGIGMDTTETRTTCYQTDYSWDAADSSGCIETTYSNPAPKVATMMFGLAMVISGGVLASRSENIDSLDYTSADNRQGVDPYNNEEMSGKVVDPSNNDGMNDTFAEKVQERQNRKDSE